MQNYKWDHIGDTCSNNYIELMSDKTNHVGFGTNEDSDQPQFDQSSLWVANDLSFLYADSED